MYLILVVMVAVVIYRGWPTRQETTVLDVLDGDSLVIRQEGMRKEVRLYAVDCPEKGQAFGPEARLRTRELALDRSVRLTQRDEDEYGRLVCEVRLPDGRILNEELVREGLAWWYRQHAPDATAFSVAR